LGKTARSNLQFKRTLLALNRPQADNRRGRYQGYVRRGSDEVAGQILTLMRYRHAIFVVMDNTAIFNDVVGYEP
jgi:hypothetical protein